MTRRFDKGLDKPGRDELHSEFGITEKRPQRIGDWVSRIVVYGDRALRDRILELLMAHGAGE